MTTPHEVSLNEWAEIMNLPEVQEAWGIKYGDSPESFSAKMAGVKFLLDKKNNRYYGDFFVIFSQNQIPRTMCINRQLAGLVVIE